MCASPAATAACARPGPSEAGRTTPRPPSGAPRGCRWIRGSESLAVHPGQAAPMCTPAWALGNPRYPSPIPSRASPGAPPPNPAAPPAGPGRPEAHTALSPMRTCTCRSQVFRCPYLGDAYSTRYSYLRHLLSDLERPLKTFCAETCPNTTEGLGEACDAC